MVKLYFYRVGFFLVLNKIFFVFIFLKFEFLSIVCIWIRSCFSVSFFILGIFEVVFIKVFLILLGVYFILFVFSLDKIRVSKK